LISLHLRHTHRHISTYSLLPTYCAGWEHVAAARSSGYCFQRFFEFRCLPSSKEQIQSCAKFQLAPISSRLVLPSTPYLHKMYSVLGTVTQYREMLLPGPVPATEPEPEPPCASCPAVGHLRKASDCMPSGAQRHSPTRYCQVGHPAQPVQLRIARSPDLLPSYCVMEWKQILRTTTDSRENLSRHG
jgi:hypothetical protein